MNDSGVWGPAELGTIRCPEQQLCQHSERQYHTQPSQCVYCDEVPINLNDQASLLPPSQHHLRSLNLSSLSYHNTAYGPTACLTIPVMHPLAVQPIFILPTSISNISISFSNSSTHSQSQVNSLLTPFTGSIHSPTSYPTHLKYII